MVYTAVKEICNLGDIYLFFFFVSRMCSKVLNMGKCSTNLSVMLVTRLTIEPLDFFSIRCTFKEIFDVNPNELLIIYFNIITPILAKD